MPARLTDHQVARIHRLFELNWPRIAIAAEVGVAESTVVRHLDPRQWKVHYAAARAYRLRNPERCREHNRRYRERQRAAAQSTDAITNQGGPE